MAKRTTPEGGVLKACMALLELRGVVAWRNNTGAVRLPGRFVRFGAVGSPDIIGVVPRGRRRGAFLGVECKRPGGKPTPAQSAFLEAVNAAGGVGVVVDDAAALAKVLDELEDV